MKTKVNYLRKYNLFRKGIYKHEGSCKAIYQ